MPTIQKIVLFIYFIWLFSSCSTSEQKRNNEINNAFICTAEELDSLNSHFVESNGHDLLFNNIENRTSKYAFSGEHSIKLTPEQPYGFTSEISDIKADQYIKVSAWRKNKNNNGVIVIDGGDGFYTAGKNIIKSSGDWQKISTEFFVPPNFKSNKVRIYVWNNSKDTVYFDDLKIHHKTSKDYPEYNTNSVLHLYLDENDIAKFNQKRLNAFRKTILENYDEDYVRTILFDGTDFLDSEIRLKGDLLDHLQGRKWSFRIKLKQDFTWNNIRTFSIQNPSTRFFLHEWVAHKMFTQEDILTTRYGFVPVIINNKSLGIYAWEEHFEKQLVESRHRREGPILRFDETLFWKRIGEANTTAKNWDIDYFSAAQIIPFKEGKTTKDSLLMQQLVEGQKLFLQYKKRSRTASDIFDIEQLAKYYALIDLTQAYHGFTWHNQRFYFNPVTCLLEPIAFDGYIENGIYKRMEEPVLSLVNPDKIKEMNREELMLFQVFSDTLFNRNYINYMEKYSSPEFINHFITTHQPATDSLKKLLQQEFPYYNFDFQYLRQQADFVRNNIEKIKLNIVQLGKTAAEIGAEKFRKEFTDEVNPKLIPFLVHAYLDKENHKIKLLNYHNSEIKILSAFIKNQLPESFDPAPVLKAYNGTFADKQSVNFSNGKPTKILFSVKGELYETAIKPWKYSETPSSRQSVTRSNLYSDTTSGKIIFEGDMTFTSDVVIPESKEVIFMPGTTINLKNGAGFFSWSNLQINGTENNPVKIYSSDNTAQGFNVFQTGKRSQINYAEFKGLSNLHRGGWQSPAAVNFYEADVDFENCIFASNFNCDDALNVVRSDFNVTKCLFENTFADAFDSDFCTGKVENCIFENIGNDAIDFSGSTVNILNCEMTEISDKAISGGEKSNLSVSGCTIVKANIGIASKDLSVLNLNKIIMHQTVYGLIAFRKKPEFGPAVINIENLKMDDNLIFHQIEEGSVLHLNSKTIHGREKNLAEKLYQ